MPGIVLPLESTDYAENIYWVFGILIKEDNPLEATTVMDLLQRVGIGSRPFFYPMHKQPVFNNRGLFINEKLPNSVYLGEKGFYLPSGLSLTEENVVYVANELKKIFI